MGFNNGIIINNFTTGNYSRKKRIIKILYASFFTVVVISNAIFGWAAPTLKVECAHDLVIEFINYSFYYFKHMKSVPSVLFILFFASDIIFFITIYRSVLQNGNKKFIVQIISIIIFKIILDYLFYQSNIYVLEKNTYENILNYSITNYLGNDNNSLYSLSIALQFACVIENYHIKNNSYSFSIFLTLNLIFCSLYYLFSNMFYTYQILFSFLIADYLNKFIKM